ncbi:MAG: FMN-dependent NADH-azoreductase, partial [Acidimicrobiales bacterium]
LHAALQDTPERNAVMASLLHIDSSVRTDSVSRRLSAAFAASWRELHPEGTYVHRDLAAEPTPHLDDAAVAVMHRLEARGTRDLAEARVGAVSDAERASWAITWPLVEEVVAASAIVAGVPMYNFSVPSTFKAWFDRVIIPPLIVDFESGEGILAGRKVVVVSARGGSYAPGTPRAASDFQEPCLRAALAMVALDSDLSFIHAEMTKAAHVPRLAQFRDLAATSLTEALAATAIAAAR